MQPTTTSPRLDYARIATELNGAALDKKLEELTQQVPPRKRMRLADVLNPYSEKLRKLHGLGWTYRQLAEELKACGLPVSVGSLREHLTKTARERKPSGKSAGRKRIRVPCRPEPGPVSERF
jgi:hypothetical protein